MTFMHSMHKILLYSIKNFFMHYKKILRLSCKIFEHCTHKKEHKKKP